MKRTILPRNSHRGSRVGAVLLAASLLAGPGLASPSAAVEPSQTSTAALEVPTSPETAPAPAPAPGISHDRAAMAAAVGPGGAEMGQRSARVAGSSKSHKAATQSAALQALTTQGTWSPSFGVKGLDVSGHQPSVNWQEQWNMGARFAYVKATEGNYFTNGSFSSQYNGARGIGMIRGAYHFAIPNWSSGADQARYFVQNGGGWSADGSTLPPVLDFEFNPYAGRTINGFYFGNTCYGMSPGQLTSWVRDFGNTMLAMTGRLPVIYTNTSWWNQCTANAAGFGDYPLWVAAYPGAPTDNAGAIPSSWSVYSMWQYSSTGPFAGDSNVWNGDYAGLRTFAGAPAPIGSFDELSLTRNGTQVNLAVRGWAIDMANSGQATEAHAYVTAPNGVRTGYVIPANAYRPDVDQASGRGAHHGYVKSIPITVSGTYSVCVYSIGASSNAALGCKSLTANGVEPPIGSVDEAKEVRSADKVVLSLRGWAVDLANKSTATQAHAYLTGPNGVKTGYAITANQSRPDVDQALHVGANHGFRKDIPITGAGNYTLCVYAIGQYSNSEINCRKLYFAPGPTPAGHLDQVSAAKTSSGATLTATGWALDSGDAARSIAVHVYVTAPDGSVKGYAFTASQSRPDVNSAFGVTGRHGFAAAIPITSPGVYRLCTYAIALSPVSPGNPLLGCGSVDAGKNTRPIGYLDSVSLVNVAGRDSLEAKGWTLDPDMPKVSNPVHTYVTAPDGRTTGYVFSTTIDRPDVNSFAGTIGKHGYSTKVNVTQRGKYTVCTYGIGISPFSTGNTILGCRTLTY